MQLVVKQAKNFRVRELAKQIESHPHHKALQADMQQINAYNPFSNNLKAMIREGATLCCASYAKQFQKVQFSLSSFWESVNSPLHLRTILG